MTKAKNSIFTSKEARRNLLLCVIAVLIAIVFLFPIYWILAMSFKSDAESFGKIVTYYPHNFTVEPWLMNLTDREFLSSLRNSLFIALCSMTISMVFGVPAAYGMDVIDIGVPILNMHAPYEVSSKADVYETTKCYKAFYEM